MARTAGNLFGQTSTCHGPAAGKVYDGGGVSCVGPGQNGHTSRTTFCRACGFAWPSGRRARSGAKITHRPEMMSCRNSDCSSACGGVMPVFDHTAAPPASGDPGEPATPG